MIQDAGDQTITGQTHREADNRSCSHRHADQWEELQYLLLPLVVTSGHQLHPPHRSPVGQGSFSGSCAVTSLINHLCEDKHGSRHLTSYQFLNFYHMTTHTSRGLTALGR